MPKFITTAKDLVTPHEATVKGFLSQALTKTQKATPYSEMATKFYAAMHKVESVNTLDVLLDDPTYRAGLIAAAGFSNKAAAHLSKKELDEAIKKVFSTLRDNFGEAFREEVVYRYLLTMGDTLGGSMRNYIGAEAANKLTAALRATLPADEATVKVQTSKTGKVRQIAWGDRLLLFDVKVAFVGNNIDVVLLDTSHATTLKGLTQVPKAHLAFGELKGGIDPAGADEHWKTARSALDRIRKRFTELGYSPALFFVGAAIEDRMSDEIFNDLQNGHLTYAANLTAPEQVQDLAEWLVSLRLVVTQ
jgi:hypothetical protein